MYSCVMFTPGFQSLSILPTTPVNILLFVQSSPKCTCNEERGAPPAFCVHLRNKQHVFGVEYITSVPKKQAHKL